MGQENRLQVRSVKLNFLLNTLRKILTYALLLITFPYINRVLGPEYIGKVKFAESIVNYFVLFTSIGIPTYGLREIARVRDDPIRRSRTVWELTSIQAVTVILGYFLYFFLVKRIGRFRQEYLLFLVISPTIVLSDFSYEWFYQGIEDQLYITIRFLIVKAFQIAAIFLFIHAPEHYYRYALIGVGMNGISTVFNIVHLRKYMVPVSRHELEYRRHLKTLSVIFLSSIAISIYTQLDVAMLGFMVGNTVVGYYSTANTIVRMVIAAVTALGDVTSPRIENCLRHGDFPSYHKYLRISLQYMLFISVPSSFGIISLAPDIIMLFAGDQFTPAIVSIRLLAPIIIIVGLAGFLGFQLLYPLRQEWKYTVSVSIAAVCNACCNYLLISRFQQNGAIIGTLVAETIGVMLQLWFARKYLKETQLFSLNTCKYFVAAGGMFLLLKVNPIPQDRVLIHCMVGIVLGSFSYILFLFLIKEQVMVSIAAKIAHVHKR